VQAKELIEKTYLSGMFQIFHLAENTLQQVLDLAVQKNITSAKIFDLRLAAIALSAQVDIFATFNVQDFTEINGLTPLSPQQIIAP
jgi:alpha-D-ribose 1-methylphosphonate 5-triphosphate synthase subunit PhnI